MKKFLVLAMVFMSTFVYSQDWTKSQRQELYELARNNFVLNKGLSEQQQKAIALCFMETVTKEYTSTEYHNKIDIELESIHNSIIDQCAKKMGLSLNKEKVKEEPKNKKLDISFSNVKGNWQGGDGSVLYLQENSKYILNESDGNVRKGKWRIEGNKLVLTWIGSLAILELTSETMTLNKGKELESFKRK